MDTTGHLITVISIVAAPLDHVWTKWTTPSYIMQWNHASDDWHCPAAENDLRKGGSFTYRMEARDGSMGFNFSGEYTRVIPNELIAFTLDDGRIAQVLFSEADGHTIVAETFEAEGQNPLDLQQQGWQAILENFKCLAEH